LETSTDSPKVLTPRWGWENEENGDEKELLHGRSLRLKVPETVTVPPKVVEPSRQRYPFTKICALTNPKPCGITSREMKMLSLEERTDAENGRPLMVCVKPSMVFVYRMVAGPPVPVTRYSIW
jgi:hypothetical protein